MMLTRSGDLLLEQLPSAVPSEAARLVHLILDSNMVVNFPCRGVGGSFLRTHYV